MNMLCSGPIFYERFNNSPVRRSVPGRRRIIGNNSISLTFGNCCIRWAMRRMILLIASLVTAMQVCSAQTDTLFGKWGEAIPVKVKSFTRNGLRVERKMQCAGAGQPAVGPLHPNPSFHGRNPYRLILSRR